MIPGAAVLTEGDRARGLFQDPNVFGPFLVPAALIVAEELVRPRLLRLSSVIKALLLAVLVLGVLFSYSRGAWLNLVLALAVMGVVFAARGGVRQALALVAIGLVGVAVVAGAVVATGSADFLAERARPQTYDTKRFSGQRAGLQPAWEYPLGAGPGQFESIAGISAHSTYARSDRRAGVLGRARPRRAARLHAAARRFATRPGVATPTGSDRLRCSPPGAACSPTARSSTRSTGATCGWWRG